MLHSWYFQLNIGDSDSFNLDLYIFNDICIMSLYDIRDNNYIQPNRFFSIRGEVVLVEREVKFSKVVLSVFSYNNIDGNKDDFTLYFKGQTKKVVDKMLKYGQHCIVMGDIVAKDGKIFLDGKIIEIFKDAPFVTEDNVKMVSPDSTNYERAF